MVVSPGINTGTTAQCPHGLHIMHTHGGHQLTMVIIHIRADIPGVSDRILRVGIGTHQQGAENKYMPEIHIH